MQSVIYSTLWPPLPSLSITQRRRGLIADTICGSPYYKTAFIHWDILTLIIDRLTSKACRCVIYVTVRRYLDLMSWIFDLLS